MAISRQLGGRGARAPVSARSAAHVAGHPQRGVRAIDTRTDHVIPVSARSRGIRYRLGVRRLSGARSGFARLCAVSGGGRGLRRRRVSQRHAIRRAGAEPRTAAPGGGGLGGRPAERCGGASSLRGRARRDRRPHRAATRCARRGERDPSRPRPGARCPLAPAHRRARGAATHPCAARGRGTRARRHAHRRGRPALDRGGRDARRAGHSARQCAPCDRLPRDVHRDLARPTGRRPPLDDPDHDRRSLESARDLLGDRASARQHRRCARPARRRHPSRRRAGDGAARACVADDATAHPGRARGGPADHERTRAGSQHRRRHDRRRRAG